MCKGLGVGKVLGCLGPWVPVYQQGIPLQLTSPRYGQSGLLPFHSERCNGLAKSPMVRGSGGVHARRACQPRVFEPPPSPQHLRRAVHPGGPANGLTQP